MRRADQRPEINMSGIPVSGIGGLGLVAIAAVMTLVLPEAWALVVAGALGGTALAVALIVFHRVHRAPGPSGDDPTILFRTEPRTQSATARPPADGSHTTSLAAAH